MRARRGIGVVGALSLLAAVDSAAEPPSFVRGVDVSELGRIEAFGGRYSRDGEPGDAVELLQGQGANFVRLGLSHAPAGGFGGFDSVVRIARRARDRGLGFFLVIYYSDRRTDVSRQQPPVAWAGLPFENLKTEVFRYTYGVVTDLRREGVLPNMIQIGNEITNGILWTTGRVAGRHDTEEQWVRFAELIRSAWLGIEAARLEGETIETVIHIDPGTDVAASTEFFDRLTEHGVEFDIIGLSFHPWWGGTLEALGTNLAVLAERYDKDVLVVETAYPWTQAWVDDHPNVVGTRSRLHPGYDPNVTGQQHFIEDLAATIAATPGGRGRGFFYWAAEKITTPVFPSRWENVALFDGTGEVLPSARALGVSIGAPVGTRADSDSAGAR